MMMFVPLFAAVFTVETLCPNGQTTVERVDVPEKDGIVRFVWPKAKVPAGVKRVKVTPDFARAKGGEDGYWVLPDNTYGTFHAGANGSRSLGWGATMAVHGMKTSRTAFAAIVTGMPYSHMPSVTAKNGEYAMSVGFVFNGVVAGERIEEVPYEDLAIEYHFLPAEESDYSAVARRYRRHQLARGAVRPLAERARERPELAYAATNLEVRMRLAWKPVPSPVPEQVRGTEPKVKPVITFDRVKDIVDECRRQGVGGQELCLVGWNYGGHDGAYPQLFPVEPALGGETKLREAILYAQDAGYQIVGHCNFRDCYLLADTFDSEYVMEKNPDGTLDRTTRPTWGGGRMYTLCPQRAYERFVVKQCAEMRALGFRGLQYSDVHTSRSLFPCFDRRHPLNNGQRAVWEANIGREMTRVFGGSASEGAFDFAGDAYDSALTIQWCQPFGKTPALVDRYVPFWQLVYHGIILSTPFRSTMNCTLDPDRTRMMLKLAEFGGRSTFYWYANFRDDRKFGGMDFDLVCSTDEELRHSVAKVKEGFDEYARRSDLQFAFMDRHELVREGLVRISYSNGAKMLVNYNDAPETLDGTAVPAHDYVVVRK